MFSFSRPRRGSFPLPLLVHGNHGDGDGDGLSIEKKTRGYLLSVDNIALLKCSYDDVLHLT
jgi:hypothetical protein